MTYSNMKTPQPVVTGITFPNDLELKKPNTYQEVKQIRDQARDELKLSCKKVEAKQDRKIPFIGKLLGTAGIITALTLLYKKGKLPFFKPKAKAATTALATV